MAYGIRTFGDPVLKAEASEITDIDGKVAASSGDLFDTLHTATTG